MRIHAANTCLIDTNTNSYRTGANHDILCGWRADGQDVVRPDGKRPLETAYDRKDAGAARNLAAAGGALSRREKRIKFFCGLRKSVCGQGLGAEIG